MYSCTLALFTLLLTVSTCWALTTCEDDLYRRCDEKARKGWCQSQAHGLLERTRQMLSECRKSCRDQLINKTYLEDVKLYGGLEDHVVDSFGFKVPLCAENGGYTAAGRSEMLNLMALNKLQPAWVPKFTEVGFQVAPIPEDVFSALTSEHRQLQSRMVKEACAKAVINCEEIVINHEDGEEFLEDKRQTFIMNPSTAIHDFMKTSLLPLAEEWANVKLEHTSTYGIRRYTNGSWLTSHVDRFNTHVISAILNVAQDVVEDWPLYILDNFGHNHKVVIQPGQMVWYESARAVHGRPQPLNGQYYDNIFIHFKPFGKWYTTPFPVNDHRSLKMINREDLRKIKT